MFIKKKYANEWQRKTILKRRTAYFAGKKCAHCGSTERLELDHIDPRSKVNKNDHGKVWKLCEEKRSLELAKCQPLCRLCHIKKSAHEHSVAKKGKPGVTCKLSPKEVQEIKNLLYLGFRQSELAKKYGVIQPQISNIKTGVHWGHIKGPNEDASKAHQAAESIWKRANNQKRWLEKKRLKSLSNA